MAGSSHMRTCAMGLVLLLGAMLAPGAQAQPGPIIPCVGCDELTITPWPETGAWYNPDQSGSGLNLEIQNGYLLGFYYGYDTEGLPEWHIISGALVASGTEGVVWELDTALQRFTGGNCTGCPYRPPSDPVAGPTIRLEFLQRNYLRLTIGEYESQYFVPIIYGSEAHQYFGKKSPYLFPKYGDYFLLVFRTTADPEEPWKWSSVVGEVKEGQWVTEGPEAGTLQYVIYLPAYSTPDTPYGRIVCAMDMDEGGPGCEVIEGKDTLIIYTMPIGNMSDSRFYGESAIGRTIEAYRLDYD